MAKMASTKLDPSTVYVLTPKGAAALATAKAMVGAAGNDPAALSALHSNHRKLVAAAAALGDAGCTGAALRAACNAAGDGNYGGHIVGRNGWAAPKPVAAKPTAAK